MKQALIVLGLTLAATPAAAWQMEVGTATVGDPVQVIFSQPFAEPPAVFILPVETATDAVAVRVEEVSDVGFSAVLVEPARFDGRHEESTVRYLAIDLGRWSMPDGTQLEVGVVDIDNLQHAGQSMTAPSWFTLPWIAPFASPPALITQLQTAFNETGFPPLTPSFPLLMPIASAVTTTAAQVALELSEQFADGLIVQPETMAYLAADDTTQALFLDLVDQRVEMETFSFATVVGWDDGCAQVDFRGSYLDPPAVFGSLVSRTEADGGWLRRCAVSPTSVLLGVDEDTDLDPERFHGLEQASVVAFSSDFVAQLGEADLAIEITDDLDTAAPGAQFDYRIVVTNMGPSPVSAVQITHTPPPEVMPLGIMETVGVFEAATGLWTGLLLGRGQSATLLFAGALDIAATGTVTLDASAVALFVEDLNPGNDVSQDATPIAMVADLSLVIDTAVAVAQLGTPFEVVFRVRNAGPGFVDVLQLQTEGAPGLLALGSTASAGSFDPESSTWSGTNLGLGGEVTLRVEAVPTSTAPTADAMGLILPVAHLDPDPTNDGALFSVAVCGQGIITNPEDCDDGNILDGDGCNSTCSTEPNFTCNGQPSICVQNAPDAGVLDATPMDAAPIDAAAMDAAPTDAMPTDAMPMDAMPMDALPMDAAPMDATVPDAMAMDALPMDAMVPDAMPTDAMAFDATTPDAGFGDAVAPDDATAADATRADATTAAADANTADAGAAVDDAASNPDVDEDGYPDELGIRGGGISCQSTGSAPSLWFLLLIVAWGAWQRRRATLLAAALLAPVTASAATESAPLDRVRSRSSDARLTFVDAARPFAQGRYSLLFATSYTKNPVVFVDQSQANAALVPAVADRLGATLGGAVGVFDSLTVSADLAIVLFQSRASSLNVGASKVDLPTLDSTAIGDLTLGATWVPFDRDKLGFNLGIFGDVALPTGGGESYRGEAGIAFEPGRSALSSVQSDLRSMQATGCVAEPTTSGW